MCVHLFPSFEYEVWTRKALVTEMYLYDLLSASPSHGERRPEFSAFRKRMFHTFTIRAMARY